MKNRIITSDNSEKNRILEMHKKNGYKTISESPMDSMFYPGDDYVKDMGNTLSDVLSSVKEKLESLPKRAISELPNPREILNNVNNFFGGDVLNMSMEEVETKIKQNLNIDNISEGFWSDFINKDWSSDTEKPQTPLKDVKGGLEQKIGAILMRIFGFNVFTGGLLGSILLKTIAGISVNVPISFIVSFVGLIVVYLVRKLILFTKERYFNDEGDN